jgi:hypothetical protein
LPCRRSRVRIPSAASQKPCLCGAFRFSRSRWRVARETVGPAVVVGDDEDAKLRAAEAMTENGGEFVNHYADTYIETL